MVEQSKIEAAVRARYPSAKVCGTGTWGAVTECWSGVGVRDRAGRDTSDARPLQSVFGSGSDILRTWTLTLYSSLNNSTTDAATSVVTTAVKSRAE